MSILEKNTIDALAFDDIHYVQQGDALIPAGETEFAKDKSFGFESWNLK